MKLFILLLSSYAYAAYPAVDYFHRRDTSSLGSNWNQAGAYFDIQSLAIRAVGSDTTKGIEWVGDSAPSNDQFSIVVLDGTWNAKASGVNGGVALRYDATTGNGYFCHLDVVSTGTFRLRVGRVDANVKTHLTSGSSSALTINAGARVRLWASGTTLSCILVDSTGATQLSTVTATDSTYTSGRVAVHRTTQNVTFAAWFGGNGDGATAIPYNANYTAGDYYISSSATNNGAVGTAADPWPYINFFADQGRLPCGSTLWVKAGTYTPNLNVYNDTALFKITQSCTTGNGISYKSIPGNIVVFDAATACASASGYALMIVTGNYTVIDGGFLGWEFTNSDTSCKVIPQCGSNPYPNPVRSFLIQADYVSVRNVRLNDNSEGFTDNTANSDATELTGNIVTNNGWNAPDREHGHGGYTHNDNGIQKVIRHSVYARNYEYQTKLYSQTGAPVGNYAVSDSVFLGGRAGFGANNGLGFLVQGSSPDNITFDRIFVYGNTFEFNQDNYLASGFSLTNSYIDGGYRLMRTINGVASNNVFSRAGTPTGSAEYSSILFNGVTSDTMPEAWSNMNNNTYFRARTGGNDFYQGVTGGTLTVYSFTGWQGLGVDGSSTYSSTVYPAVGTSPSASSPQAATVMAHPLKTGTGLVSIINYRQDATVNANVSTILSTGDPYEVYDTQCWSCGPIQTGIYGGGNLSFDMTLTTIQPPAGNYSADPGSVCAAVSDGGSPSTHPVTTFTHTEPNIGAFIVRRRQVYRTVVQSTYNNHTSSTQVTTESGPSASDLSFPAVTQACAVSATCNVPIATQLVGNTFYRLTFKDAGGSTIWQSSSMRVPVD